MRAAFFPTLALPLLLTYCGAKGDLIIGELQPVMAGSPSVIPSAGSGATTAVAGSDQGGVGGGAGTVSEGGTTAGDMPIETAGAAGAPPSPCLDTEEPPLASLIH